MSSDGMKFYYDRKANFSELTVGDALWFHSPIRKQGLSLKLQSSWKCPYIIIEKLSNILYKIQESPRGKPKMVHYDRLKVYQGEINPHGFISNDLKQL